MTSRILSLNDAEGIFFPAFDKHLCKDEEITIDRGTKERLWDGLSFCGSKEFDVCWNGEVDVKEYDRFLCFLRVPPTAQIRADIMVDGTEVPLFETMNGDGAPLDIDVPLPKFKEGILTKVCFHVVSEAEQTILFVSWLGLGNFEKQAFLEQRIPVWNQKEADTMLEHKAGEILDGVLFSKAEGGV